MSATLATLSITQVGSGFAQRGYRVLVSCEHAITVAVLRRITIREVLAQHYRQSDCDCLTALWRTHWGAPLGEAILARGTS